MAAPALLVAARAKFLAASPTVPAQYVTVDVDPLTGLPPVHDANQPSVTFYLRSASWRTNDTSARFPKLGVTVWTVGDRTTNDAEWQARAVAESVLDEFDDPAGEQPPTWSDSVYVIFCKWDGELAVSEVEDQPGMYRADLGLNLEVV